METNPEETPPKKSKIRAYTPPSFDEGVGAGGPAAPATREERLLAAAEDEAEGFLPVVEQREGPEPEESFDQGFKIEEAGPDFASIRFTRENTLLTNAEAYADSIRQEAELYVSELRKDIDKLNAEAELRYEEVAKLKAETEEEYDRRISEAEDLVSTIRQGAHEEGFKKGMEEGIQKRYEESAPFLDHIQAVAETLAGYNQELKFNVEKDSVRLAVLMAKKILAQELKTNKKVIWKLLASVMTKLEGKGTFQVWMNPEDLKFAVQAKPSLEKFLSTGQALNFSPRAEIAQGNAQIETDREVIDLSISTQMNLAERAINQALAEREARHPKIAPPAQPKSDKVEGTTQTPALNADQGEASVPGKTDESVQPSPGGMDPFAAQEAEGESVNPPPSENAPPESSLSGEGADPFMDQTNSETFDPPPDKE